MACVLFTDLVGSTELMAQLGDAAFDRLRTEHFAQIRRVVERRGGTEVKNTGDGILATFSSAVEAVAAAVADASRTAERIGAPIWLARTQLEWARTLLRRNSPGDGERGRSLLYQVIDSATGLGLVAVERQAHVLLEGRED